MHAGFVKKHVPENMIRIFNRSGFHLNPIISGEKKERHFHPSPFMPPVGSARFIFMVIMPLQLWMIRPRAL